MTALSPVPTKPRSLRALSTTCFLVGVDTRTFDRSERKWVGILSSVFDKDRWHCLNLLKLVSG